MTTLKAKTLTAAALAAGLLLTGCASDPGSDPATDAATTTTPSPSATNSSEPAASESPATSPSPDDQVASVDVTVKGDTITPNGDRIDLGIGETLQLNVTADRAGELHVHSRPEQTPPYPKGTSTVKLKVDHPGVVDVEDHESGIVVLQLEVR